MHIREEYKKEEEEPLITSEESKKSHGNNIYMFLCSGIVLLGALAIGTVVGLSSPLIPDIQEDHSKGTPHLSTIEASYFGGILLIGAMVGGLGAGYVMQSIGRKRTSIISALPYAIGLILIASASHVWMLFVGRFISGVGVGITSVIVPVYIGEIAPAHLRGTIGSGNQVCIVVGILVIYALGLAIPWRYYCTAIAIIPCLLFFLSFFLVETPRCLLMKGENHRAKQALQKLRGLEEDIERELEDLQASLCVQIKPATWKEIFTQKELRTPTILSLGAMYFQQNSGINSVMFYADTLFQTAGFTTPSQLTLALMSVSGTQVTFTIISCLIIDRAGRKLLLLISGTFMSLSLLVFGIYFQLIDGQTTPNTSYTFINSSRTTISEVATLPAAQSTLNITWMALVSMMVFNAAFSIGFGPIAWLLLGEMIPIRARGSSAGLATAFNNLMAFLLTFFFSSMLKALTPQGTFWLFSVNCAMSIVFVIFALPETKGKTLEEIELYFQGNGKKESLCNRKAKTTKESDP